MIKKHSTQLNETINGQNQSLKANVGNLSATYPRNIEPQIMNRHDKRV